jgi:hypothetical protein
VPTESRALVLKTIRVGVHLPQVFYFEKLASLPAVEQLAKDKDLAHDFLQILLTGNLESYRAFTTSHPTFLTENRTLPPPTHLTRTIPFLEHSCFPPLFDDLTLDSRHRPLQSRTKNPSPNPRNPLKYPLPHTPLHHHCQSPRHRPRRRRTVAHRRHPRRPC